MVRKFDMVLEHLNQPMETNCAWFVYTPYQAQFEARETT
jgi:hypothetical protein